MLYFVYGSLLEGMHNHHILGPSEFVGKGELKGFEMYSLGSFPAIIPSNSKITIKGELYNVTSPMIEEMLDKLEGYRKNSNSSFYNKSVVDVIKPDGAVVKAYVYHFVVKPDYFDLSRVVADGDWKKYMKNHHYY